MTYIKCIFMNLISFKNIRFFISLFLKEVRKRLETLSSLLIWRMQMKQLPWLRTSLVARRSSRLVLQEQLFQLQQISYNHYEWLITYKVHEIFILSQTQRQFFSNLLTQRTNFCSENRRYGVYVSSIHITFDDHM